MATEENTFNVSAPYVRQIGETSWERGPSGAYDVQTDLPGHLELCVDVDGAPWIIARRKAPGLLKDIERAREAQQAQQASAPAPALTATQPPAEQQPQPPAESQPPAQTQQPAESQPQPPQA